MAVWCVPRIAYRRGRGGLRKRFSNRWGLILNERRCSSANSALFAGQKHRALSRFLSRWWTRLRSRQNVLSWNGNEKAAAAYRASCLREAERFFVGLTMFLSKNLALRRSLLILFHALSTQHF